jgi:hypothetical protein
MMLRYNKETRKYLLNSDYENPSHVVCCGMCLELNCPARCDDSGTPDRNVLGCYNARGRGADREAVTGQVRISGLCTESKIFSDIS